MTETVAGCPVSHTDYRLDRPIFGNYALLDAEREQSPFFLNDATEHPFWMVTRYEHVLEALQMPEVFCNDISNALSPARPFRFQPNNLNGDEHVRLRRVLNRWFSPAAVRRLEPLAVKRCAALISGLAPCGECDLIADFAIRFPTDMFLATLGLPVADGALFVGWVDALFAGLYQDAAARAAAAAIEDYFDAAIADRIARPRDPDTDFLTRMLDRTIIGDWLSREDLRVVCLSLMTAGLDTTRSALGYLFAHLAAHPADRRRLLDDPGQIPRAVEETVRLCSLILQDGRRVTRDIDFHGLPMRAGDVVWLGIASANRDPRAFPHPDRYDPDRADLGRHLGFGAGPHRCLGMHLARHELTIALREWHERVPDYHLAPQAKLVERGAQLSLRSLPLRWDRGLRGHSPTESVNALKEMS